MVLCPLKSTNYLSTYQLSTVGGLENWKPLAVPGRHYLWVVLEDAPLGCGGRRPVVLEDVSGGPYAGTTFLPEQCLAAPSVVAAGTQRFQPGCPPGGDGARRRGLGRRRRAEGRPATLHCWEKPSLTQYLLEIGQPVAKKKILMLTMIYMNIRRRCGSTRRKRQKFFCLRVQPEHFTWNGKKFYGQTVSGNLLTVGMILQNLIFGKINNSIKPTIMSFQPIQKRRTVPKNFAKFQLAHKGIVIHMLHQNATCSNSGENHPESLNAGFSSPTLQYHKITSKEKQQ